MRRILLLWVLLPIYTIAQNLDSLHILLDAEAKTSSPYVYRTFQEASLNLKEGSSSSPMTIYIKPGVYWIDDPDDPNIKKGVNGREPFGMVVHCRYLNIVGVGQKAEDVVLASQRGQTQGAIGNFTMFDFWVKTLKVKNLTMGNYCNVDLVYPLNPSLNRLKRSNTITQAHIGYVHGDTLQANNVRFISRLNLNPLNGAKYSLYDSCHFESTDDALNGTAIYRNCDFDFYGQKPFWSTFGKGAMFVNCDFKVKNRNKEMFFTKQGGPLTIINCRYSAPSDSIYIGWTAYPKPWLRCYQHNFTLNGKPYLIGSRNPQNTVQSTFLQDTLQSVPFLDISQHDATLLTDRDTLTLYCPEPVDWHIESGYEKYINLNIDTSAVIIPKNYTDEIVEFCIIATTHDGREAACNLSVLPSRLSPPYFVEIPKIKQKGNMLKLNYKLSLNNHYDESKIIWYRDSIPVAYSNIKPQKTYALKEADEQHTYKVVVTPKHNRSDYGKAIETTIFVKGITPQNTLETDFHDFYTNWQPQIAEGLWTIDGYKPLDTNDFSWSFDSSKPMWEYSKGINGAKGFGLLQAQRGARLMYSPAKRDYNNMSLVLEVDPSKTAGQGFGSATGQYMDICLKFNTATLTGYGLRIIRTTKYSNAVDFFLVRYDNGIITPISDSISSTCYRTGCTIKIDFKDNILAAKVSTTTPKPTESVLPHEVSLSAKVSPNRFGGVHIQHTGSCGESTTMLHRLKVVWN